jgi:hypothetical protein
MAYKENPKTKGSGIYCMIPQRGRCPRGCPDCFFQSGRSYLEPLGENLPNVPALEDCRYNVLRVNDGLDSNVARDLVISTAAPFPLHFFNVSDEGDVRYSKFPGPVVATVNPGEMTDDDFTAIDPIPRNLMMVRLRVNTWNIFSVVEPAVRYYTELEVPVILTFMAYHEADSIPPGALDDYVERKRTSNSYWAITTASWRAIMRRHEDNIFVYSCGKIEGEKGSTKCERCGNCLREFFATKERMR